MSFSCIDTTSLPCSAGRDGAPAIDDCAHRSREGLVPAAFSGGVELEIHGPDLMGLFGLVTTHRAIRRSGPLLPSRCRALQFFLAPEALQLLLLHQLPFPLEQAKRHTPSPTDVFSCNLPESPPELGLLNVDNLGGMSLSAAVLTHHPACEPFRAQGFPSANSYGFSGPAARPWLSLTRLPPVAF